MPVVHNDMSLQCHSNERIGLIRGKIANLARVSLDQVHTLMFGEGGSGALISAADQDNRLLHHIGVHTNTPVIAKINTTGAAQLKEVSFVDYVFPSIHVLLLSY